jgi:gamma-glutamyl-gamma-aminobutyrate hydrolase PuuD
MDTLRILLPLSDADVRPILRSKSRNKLLERGFAPLIVTPSMTSGQLDRAYVKADGVLFPGGRDIDPRFYRHPGHPEIGEVDPTLDQMQLEIIKKTHQDGKPFLGICRGAQMLAVAYQGTLHPHITEQFPSEDHGASIDVDGPSSHHDVQLTKRSIAHEIFGTSKLKDMVSRHHQAINDPGLLVVTGFSPAGSIEAVENPSLPFQLGVQWHPDLPQLTPQNTELMNQVYTAFHNAILVYSSQQHLRAS